MNIKEKKNNERNKAERDNQDGKLNSHLFF